MLHWRDQSPLPPLATFGVGAPLATKGAQPPLPLGSESWELGHGGRSIDGDGDFAILHRFLCLNMFVTLSVRLFLLVAIVCLYVCGCVCWGKVSTAFSSSLGAGDTFCRQGGMTGAGAGTGRVCFLSFLARGCSCISSILFNALSFCGCVWRMLSKLEDVLLDGTDISVANTRSTSGAFSSVLISSTVGSAGTLGGGGVRASLPPPLGCSRGCEEADGDAALARSGTAGGGVGTSLATKVAQPPLPLGSESWELWLGLLRCWS